MTISQYFVDDLFVTTTGDALGTPVLLVHGSTETGFHDWFEASNVGPQLAESGYFVIAPDCPGHGRSGVERDRSGAVQYSFEGMAEQLAALIVRLCGTGRRAHVIGHSNGGTVSLYLARYHAEVVDRVACLAGNAYIDERIRNGVPSNMAPDRIDRERPEWRDDMIAFHDRWHGDGYWRELVQATIEETITKPNWSAHELSACRTSVLAIQGSNDGVNVAGRHAETIAKWFPDGASWLVAGAGHSVHWERPAEFCQVVGQFLRGPGGASEGVT
jgi:2-hydroxymuconate-semialdehyde hydrolase